MRCKFVWQESWPVWQAPLESLAGTGDASTGPDFLTLSGAAAFPGAVAGVDVVFVSVVML